MPNQHSATRQAVTFRLDRQVLAAAKALAAERGETMTSVVERALAEYAPITTPPPAPAQPQP